MRTDLLALTAEALVRLANVGLVKRAQKEVTSGVLPTLAEELDGTVTGTARDGAMTRLPRGVPLQQTTCSCGATGVCRHRIALVLAYQAQHATSTASTTWDPGTVTDEAVLHACGAAAVARADAALAHGVVATVRAAGGTPSVAVPNATVQFLVPDDLAYAKCDCSIGHGCEHVVIAVRAFRAAPTGGVVTLQTTAAPRLESDAAPRTAITAALGYLVQFGLAGPGAVDALVRARNAAERAGW